MSEIASGAQPQLQKNESIDCGPPSDVLALKSLIKSPQQPVSIDREATQDNRIRQEAVKRVLIRSHRNEALSDEKALPAPFEDLWWDDGSESSPHHRPPAPRLSKHMSRYSMKKFHEIPIEVGIPIFGPMKEPLK